MEKIDIVLWVISGGFTLIFTLMLVIWGFLTKRIDGVEERLEKKINGLEERLEKKISEVESKLDKKISDIEYKLEKKIDKLNETVTDIDRRVCRMEGAMHNKEGCVIKTSNDLRKAE